MLVLNQHGVLPAGVHDATLDEVRQKFAFNAHRKRLMNMFESELDGWTSMECWRVASDVYMDGSFVTDKPLPNDIECAVAIDPDASSRWTARLIEAIKDTRARTSRKIDCYCFIPGVGHDFSLFFQYMRRSDADARRMSWSPNRPMKGIIRLVGL